MMKRFMFTLLLIGAVTARAQDGERKITSLLEVLDVITGQRSTIREFDCRIEAPNWTKDGRWLVFNSHGLLYRIDASGRGNVRLIDTAYLENCNNDHLLSPDGKTIAVSASSDHEKRSSYIYILPIEGGNPRLITPYGPSYLHGWSPDGKTLAYCAFRTGGMDIYTIDIGGGEEVRLTDAEGLDDGPEYSPDGEYIWFNSARTGLMQVWRMRPDGSEQTQITFDDTRNAWFPHVSPDGQWVVYLAYRKGDVEAGQHLADKHVELRLMPSAGGEPKTIAELFGGQGSINVNSWAPDSKRVAFVSYRMEE